MSKKSSGKGARIALIALCVVLALILVALVAGTVFLETTLNRINKNNSTSEATLSSDQLASLYQPDETEESGDESIPEMQPDDVTWPDFTGDLVGEDDHIINILLIGQDRRNGQGRQRSDSMILCTFNTQKKTLTLTSFLRDTYVQIPGYKANRLNVPYMIGGMELLDKTLEQNFGVQVDGNVEVDFNQFMDIIDLLGGVDIELTQKEADYLNRRGNWGVDDDKSWTLTKGVNHLTGSQALAYSRIRYLDSDFGRTNRQRNVLNALIKAYKDLPVSQMLSVLYEILPMITTDMTNSEIVNYAIELFPMLSSCTITSQHIPADGAYTSQRVNGMAVLVPDLAKCQQILAESIGD